MTHPLVADTNILWGETNRDILRALHRSKIIVLHWGPWLKTELNIELFPESYIAETLPPIGLPDLNDEPIAATAILARCQSLLTFNKKDFPATAMPQISILTLDDFLMTRLDEKILAVLDEVRRHYELSAEDFSARLNRARLHKLSTKLRPLNPSPGPSSSSSQ